MFLQAMKSFFFEILGFKRNSKYVKNYINEVNVRTSIYMSVIVFALEVWMIIRSLGKYVIPAINNGTNWFDAIFNNTSLYFLFMFVALAMMFFSIFYLKDKTKLTVAAQVLTYLFPAILVCYVFFIFKEDLTKWNSQYYVVSNLGTIFLYFFSLLFAIFIALHTLYKTKNKKNSMPLSITVIVLFAAICLTFGIKVGYTDFFSRFNNGNGLPKPKNGVYEIKSIMCFLTMSIYIGCLLIWKPYISIVTLCVTFFANYFLLSSDPQNRLFPDGEFVNYITFLISLIAICISMYVQRVHEALKDESLERIAKEDDLTGIFNNRHFNEEALSILQTSEDLNEYTFLFINIENFKTYNDEKGFQAGNELLISFAHLLEFEFKGDLVARQSDDHFIVLTSSKDFMDKIMSLQEALSKESEVFLELKVGGYHPEHLGQNIRRSVDKARFAAGTIKQKYDKIYAEYDSVMDEKYHKRQYIINNIDVAIENGYIRPYYQPVVWSKNSKLCGCEALARWIDPKYGFLSPGDFVPVLEEHRQIHKLDKCIFEMVCRDLADAIKENRPIVPVSLNFSRLDFELMDAVKEFEELVNKYNIPKDYLHVEITESALTDNLGLLKRSIEKLEKDGYALWLDDFGSGYSSLNVLKDYKFDVLKIDMTFLTNFDNNPKSKDILECIIALANRLGMKTLAEGVETKSQAEFLEKIGCGRLQGYLFGKPHPLNELREAIKEGKYVISDEII